MSTESTWPDTIEMAFRRCDEITRNIGKPSERLYSRRHLGGRMEYIGDYDKLIDFLMAVDVDERVEIVPH